MADEFPPSDQLKPEDEDQGQKMTIYMPTGAVIVERSDFQVPADEPATKKLPEARHAAPNVGTETVQSLGAVINIYTGSDSHGMKEQSHDRLSTTGNADLNDKQVLLRISELLDVMTKRLDHDGQQFKPAIERNSPSEFMRITNWDKEIRNTPSGEVMKDVQKNEVIENKSADVQESKIVEKNFNSETHIFDWLHALNLIYIFLIVLIPLVPSSLNAFLNIEVKPALVSYQAAGIHSGDLLITENVPASSIAVGDFLTVHNAFTGHYENVIRISEISVSVISGLTTLSSFPRAGEAITPSYEVKGSSEAERVIKSVPNLGTGKILFDSLLFKLAVGLAVILLNVVVHFRRRRRFRA